MVFGDKLTLKFEKELPLDECIIEGGFVLTDDELFDVKRFYDKARECYNSNKCKVKKVRK